MLFAITTLVFVVVFLVFYVFALGGEKYSLSDKLKDIGKTSQPAYVNEELEQPLYKRIFGPPVQQASALILQFTPQAWRQKAEPRDTGAKPTGIFWLSLMFLCIKVSLNNDVIVP